MSETKTAQSGGIGVSGLLLVVFICAKVFGLEPVASWSWFWVFCPVWIPLMVILVILLALLSAYLILAAVKALLSMGKKRG